MPFFLLISITKRVYFCKRILTGLPVIYIPWCRPLEALEQEMGRLERCALLTDKDSEEISEDLNAIEGNYIN